MDPDTDPEAWVQNVLAGGVPPKPANFRNVVNMPHFPKPCYLRNASFHRKNELIVFFEGPHVYEVSGKKVPRSVTGMKKKYFAEFDAPSIAAAMVSKEAWYNPQHPDYGNYARYNRAVPEGTPPKSWRDVIYCIVLVPTSVEVDRAIDAWLNEEGACRMWRAWMLPRIVSSSNDRDSVLELARYHMEEVSGDYAYWVGLLERGRDATVDLSALYASVERDKRIWLGKLQGKWAREGATLSDMTHVAWPARRPLTAEEVQQLWVDNGTEQSNRGTFTHFAAESAANGMAYTQEIVDSIMIRQFFDDHPTWEAFLTEHEIFFGTYESGLQHGSILAGSVDALFRDRITGKFILVDWKRSVELARFVKSTSRFPPKKCNGVLQHLDDTIVNQFAIQLNLYKLMYRQYGIDIAEMYVVCLHPMCLGLNDVGDDDVDPNCERVQQLVRAGGKYLKLQVPEMQREVWQMMREWAEECVATMPETAASALAQLAELAPASGAFTTSSSSSASAASAVVGPRSVARTDSGALASGGGARRGVASGFGGPEVGGDWGSGIGVGGGGGVRVRGEVALSAGAGAGAGARRVVPATPKGVAAASTPGRAPAPAAAKASSPFYTPSAAASATKKRAKSAKSVRLDADAEDPL